MMLSCKYFGWAHSKPNKLLLGWECGRTCTGSSQFDAPKGSIQLKLAHRNNLRGRIMQRLTAVLVLLMTVIGSGCASMQVERAKDVSSAGIAYAKATSAVVDAAIDATIDTSTKVRLEFAKGPLDQGTLSDGLKRADDALVVVVEDYAKLKRSIAALEAYWLGLQTLAGATPGAAAETAVKTLADRVNATAAALDKPGLLSDAQKNAVAGLAGTVIKTMHGVELARALERDAETIGRALAFQQAVLGAALSKIALLGRIEQNEFYETKVLKPYATKTIGATWAADRKVYIKAAALGNLSDAVKAAQDASKQMGDVWARTLEGKLSIAEVGLVLKEIGSALDALDAVKKAF